MQLAYPQNDTRAETLRYLGAGGWQPDAASQVLLQKAEDALRAAAEGHVPVALHIATVKGKGYAPAERNPSKWHGVAPWCREGRKDAGSAGCSALTGRFAPCRANAPSAKFLSAIPLPKKFPSLCHFVLSPRHCRAVGGRGSEGNARTVSAQPTACLLYTSPSPRDA